MIAARLREVNFLIHLISKSMVIQAASKLNYMGLFERFKAIHWELLMRNTCNAAEKRYMA